MLGGRFGLWGRDRGTLPGSLEPGFLRAGFLASVSLVVLVAGAVLAQEQPVTPPATPPVPPPATPPVTPPGTPEATPLPEVRVVAPTPVAVRPRQAAPKAKSSGTR